MMSAGRGREGDVVGEGGARLHRPARPRPVMVEMTEMGVSVFGEPDPVGAGWKRIRRKTRNHVSAEKPIERLKVY